MRAIFQDGCRQYSVTEGDSLLLDLRPAEKGDEIAFDRVLMCSSEADVRVGAPYVDGATVEAKVLGQELGPKVIIGKIRRRKRYRRKTGFRARYTRIQITKISA